MLEGGVPLSHLLSRKEKVIRAGWGRGWIVVDAAWLRQRGQHRALPTPSSCWWPGHKAAHALCPQMGLRVSGSLCLALA